MKKILLVLASLIAISTVSATVSAAQVEVKWTNPDKYRDIYAGDENRKVFRERLFKSLDKHFAKLASKLPEKQVLKIDVKDVDLAGDVSFGSINRIRIVKDIYFPRFKFSYQLIDEKGKVIKSGKENLKDMNSLHTNNLRYKNESFGYEKRMIENWFNKTFKTRLSK